VWFYQKCIHVIKKLGGDQMGFEHYLLYLFSLSLPLPVSLLSTHTRYVWYSITMLISGKVGILIS